MKIFKNFNFINRLTKIPRTFFSFSKKLGLTIQQLDLILKLYNYNHQEEITPNLTNISDRSGVSMRSFQGYIKQLKEKEFISVQQNKTKEGKFTTNTYDLTGFYESIKALNMDKKQLSMDFSESSIFGEGSSALSSIGYIATPRALDFFQKELDLSTQENVFIKYLLGYIDMKGIAEISLNYTAKTTPFSRTMLSKIVKSLSDKGFIVTKEKFCGKGRRVRNRYDINPILIKINQLEQQKVKQILIEKGEWVDYNKKRKPVSISHQNYEKENKIKQEKPIKTLNRIRFLENEVRRLQPEIKSKDCNIAVKIREYQSEINSLKYTNKEEYSFKTILANRFKQYKKKKNTEYISEGSKVRKADYIHAKRICEKLNGDWEKNFNFYIKAVKVFPNSIERYVASANEKAKISKEKYFTKSVGKAFLAVNTL